LPKEQDGRLYGYAILNSIHIWSLILAILGFAKKHLNFSNSFLRYTNKAVYPFYILHQTAIVVVGYYVLQWRLPIFLKMILLIIACFLTIGILYNWVIKPFIITRILYGLKPSEKDIRVQQSVP
jgi:glucan biosynthesis protein C